MIDSSVSIGFICASGITIILVLVSPCVVWLIRKIFQIEFELELEYLKRIGLGIAVFIWIMSILTFIFCVIWFAQTGTECCSKEYWIRVVGITLSVINCFITCILISPHRSYTIPEYNPIPEYSGANDSCICYKSSIPHIRDNSCGEIRLYCKGVSNP